MRKAIALGALVSMTMIFPAVAQAEPRADRPAVSVTGTWIGMNSGFEAGVFVSRPIRYTISQMNGHSLTGVKSWRLADGTWSEGEPFQGVLRKTGEFMTSDPDGIFIGQLTARNRITGTYLEVGADAAALSVTLTKQRASN